LLVVDGSGPGLPVVSMGRAAARGRAARRRACTLRVAGSLVRPFGAASHRGLAHAVAAVPPDARLGAGQARERRSDVALADGADLSLRDAADSDAARVVRASDAGMVPEGV